MVSVMRTDSPKHCPWHNVFSASTVSTPFTVLLSSTCVSYASGSLNSVSGLVPNRSFPTNQTVPIQTKTNNAPGTLWERSILSTNHSAETHRD